jgi:hypothetical protein
MNVSIGESCDRPREAGKRPRLAPTRKRRVLASMILPLACLLLAAPAGAHKISKKEQLEHEKAESLPFANCPLTTAQLCLLANTTGGEFVIGSKAVPIGKPILLQGGRAEDTVKGIFGTQALIAPAKGEALAKVPQEVPGGLSGIDGIGGAVTATAEIAGPTSGVLLTPADAAFGAGTAVVLPFKVKLSNEVLGENCYVGSDAEPIVLHLTDGTTTPPEGTAPISGSHSFPENTPVVTRFKSIKLVDNTFSVPGASGCGNELDEAVVDEAVDLDIGLPSAAGKNTAIMSGSVELAVAATVSEKLTPTKKHKKS